MEVIILEPKEIYLISVSLITVLTIVVLRSFGLVQPMSILGGIVGNIAGHAIGSIFGKHNAKAQADIQLDSWNYMQSNKHQLEVEDLRKAGLNPILSAGNGSAVSAPSVSFGSSDNGLGQTTAQSITAAKQLKIAQTEADSNRINAEAAKSQADTAKILAESQAALYSTQQGYYNAMSGKAFAEASKVRQDIANSIIELQQNIKESNARINLYDSQSFNINELTPYQKNKMIQEGQHLLTQMKVDEKEIALLDKELNGLSAEKKNEYLSSWLGDKLTYLGFVGEDLSKMTNAAGNVVKMWLGNGRRR